MKFSSSKLIREKELGVSSKAAGLYTSIRGKRLTENSNYQETEKRRGNQWQGTQGEDIYYYLRPPVTFQHYHDGE